jgi:hypothetical protein
VDRGIALHLFRLQEDSARKKGLPFELTFADWLAIWGSDLDRRGRLPGDLYLERIEKPKGYVRGNLRISVRKPKR